MEQFIISIIDSGARIEKKFGNIAGLLYVLSIFILALTVVAIISVGLFSGMIDGIGPKLFGPSYIGFIR